MTNAIVTQAPTQDQARELEIERSLAKPYELDKAQPSANPSTNRSSRGSSAYITIMNVMTTTPYSVSILESYAGCSSSRPLQFR